MRYLCNLLYFLIILDIRSFPSYAPAINDCRRLAKRLEVAGRVVDTVLEFST